MNNNPNNQSLSLYLIWKKSEKDENGEIAKKIPRHEQPDR